MNFTPKLLNKRIKLKNGTVHNILRFEIGEDGVSYVVMENINKPKGLIWSIQKNVLCADIMNGLVLLFSKSVESTPSIAEWDFPSGYNN